MDTVETNICPDVIPTNNEDSQENSVTTNNTPNKPRLLCGICQSNGARYKCPGCLAVTCSCACFKSHKEQTGCNGQRDRVPVALGDETPEEMLMRDCRFLEDVLSKIDKSYRNPKFHHLIPKKQGRGVKRSAYQQDEGNPLPARMLYGKQKTSAELKSRFQHVIPEYPYHNFSQDGWQASRFDLSRPLKKLRYEARMRNATVSFLPRGMSRHVDNTSHFDEKCNAIRWRLRLVFVHADAYVEHTVHEDTRLGQVVAKVLDTPCDQLRVFSCNDSTSDGSALKPALIDGSKSDDTISDPLENGWSEQRRGNEQSNSVKDSSGNGDLVGRRSGPISAGVTVTTPVLNNHEAQSSSEFSQSVESSTLTEVRTDTNISTESQPIADESFPIEGRTFHNQNSKPVKKSPQLLPFQELQSLDPVGVYSSTLNPFIEQPNPYKLSPFKSLVTDMTPGPGTDSSHAPSPSEVDQMMFYKAAGVAQLAVVFRHEKLTNAGRFSLMDLTDTIKDNLVDLNVVEYPIMLVMRKDHVYEFLNRTANFKENDLRNLPVKHERVEEKQEKEASGLKYFDADCSFDDEQ